MDSITFNTAENKLTVVYREPIGAPYYSEALEQEVQDFSEPVTKDYFDRASYLADWPDRGADCDAMGWA